MELSQLAWIDTWLDDNVSQSYKNEPLAQDWARISKVSEELGEAVNAFVGTTGQNPRKGLTHDMDDVLGTSGYRVDRYLRYPAFHQKRARHIRHNHGTTRHALFEGKRNVNAGTYTRRGTANG